ncbi:Cof-type HAD-IIB family hydrolase [Robertmurraya korlensis]|uniref:Cof-type HAD-IIB family hydrolase n=1 Tax=Robertmurraya korlensis TaxID=519977 RepID=UPI0020416982|nr:Cof-type HAD-IIB family hydrolase [Robertmurraya korlensis]MCM3603248.1 Cof-type HAD-IIB family hydrolase [Robertmurraya korlensis]
MTLPYKMIVLDLDDTLLNDEHSLSKRNKEALMAAQELGVKVVLASGRPTFGMVSIAKDLQLDQYGSYILSFNGSKIINAKTNEEMFNSTISSEMAHRLYDLSKREGVAILSYKDESIVIEEPNEYADIEATITGLPMQIVDQFKATITEPVVKAMMLAHPDVLVDVEQTLVKEVGEEVSVFRSKPFFLEFTALNVTKGTSLHQLTQKLGIAAEEVIAIGDSYNDITMIEFAGLGVAMGNAPDAIKEIANHVTETNNNDGVAQVVEEFILSKVKVVTK